MRRECLVQPCGSEQGQPEQVAQDHGCILHNLCGQPVLAFDNTHRRKKKKSLNGITLFQFVPLVFSLVIAKKSDSFSSCQVFIHSYTIPFWTSSSG